MAQQSVTKEQYRCSDEVSARYIDHEDDVNSLENVRDVVEWNSPNVCSQAQVEYCGAVVSSPDRV